MIGISYGGIAALRAAALAAMREHAVEPEYVAVVDPDTFDPVADAVLRGSISEVLPALIKPR